MVTSVSALSALPRCVPGGHRTILIVVNLQWISLPRNGFSIEDEYHTLITVARSYMLETVSGGHRYSEIQCFQLIYRNIAETVPETSPETEPKNSVPVPIYIYTGLII